MSSLRDPKIHREQRGMLKIVITETENGLYCVEANSTSILIIILFIKLFINSAIFDNNTIDKTLV